MPTLSGSENVAATGERDEKDLVTLDDIDRDIAEFYCHYILQQQAADTQPLFDNLEKLFPRITPLDKSSSVSIRYQCLVLWQEALWWNTAGLVDADFDLVKDKLINLKRKYFQKSHVQEYKQVMTFLQVLKQLSILNKTMNEHPDQEDDDMDFEPNTDQLTAALNGYKKRLKTLYFKREIPQELLEFHQSEDGEISCEQLSNGIQELITKSDFGFHAVQDKIRNLLLHWLDSKLESPKLLQCGYLAPFFQKNDANTQEKEDSKEEEEEKKEPEEEERSPPPSNRKSRKQTPKQSVVEKLSPDPNNTSLDLLESPGFRWKQSSASRGKPRTASQPRTFDDDDTVDFDDGGERTGGSQEEKEKVVKAQRKDTKPESDKKPTPVQPNNNDDDDAGERAAAIEGSKKRAAPIMTIWDSSDDEETEALLARQRPVQERLKIQRYSRPQDDSSDDEEEATAELGRRRAIVSAKKRKVRLGDFTTQEKDAVISGVRKFGFGNWNIIQKRSNGILKYRSASQVREMALIMQKNGQF